MNVMVVDVEYENPTGEQLSEYELMERLNPILIGVMINGSEEIEILEDYKYGNNTFIMPYDVNFFMLLLKELIERDDELLIIFHNYDFDGKYINVGKIIERLGIKNKIEFNTSNVYGIMYYNGVKRIYIIDTARLTYKKLPKTSTALQSKMTNKLEDYLARDLMMTK
jgi:hypothetical protein